jgi:DNA repair protein RecO (recombination protein O)
MSAVTKTRAVVINSLRHGESDLIVTFLTEEHGVVKGFARGAMRSRKRFAGSLEPFTLVELRAVLKEESLARVDGADILDTHPGLMDNLDRLNAAACIAELATLLEPPATESEDAFRLVESALEALRSSVRPVELVTVYILKYLDVTGYGVHTDICSDCGGKISGEAGYRGGEGLLCARCAGRGGMVLSPGLVAFIRKARAIEEQKAGRLRYSPVLAAEFAGFMAAYLRAVTGRTPKSFSALTRPSIA